MNNKIQKLRDYSDRTFSDGIACGVALTTVAAGAIDFFNDGNFDHPYLIGIPLLISFGSGVYNTLKYGKDKGLKNLERELF